ncbi:MAG: alpha/beta hydrolase [Pseudomonadota bacterium]|nr:alpha/beta hydrolase [Pseudomonadota bacterium]
MLGYGALGIIGLLAGLALFSLWGQHRIEREVPPIGQFIDIDGVRLHYIERGRGQPIILLHGASSNLRDFASSIVDALARDYRVLAFDRPGYGYSQRLPGDWADPASVMDLILRASTQLGAEQPIVLGHSWSGALVMAALVEYPDRIRGGVSVAGVAGHWAGSVGWTYDIGKLPVIGPLFAWTMVYPVGRDHIHDAVVGVLAPDPVPPAYVDNIGGRLALRPRSFLYNVEDTTRLNEYMQNLSPRYDEITQPLLIIHGEADTLVPFWNHGRRVLPVVQHAQVVMIPGAGHAPHHAHPGAVTHAIVRSFPPTVESP